MSSTAHKQWFVGVCVVSLLVVPPISTRVAAADDVEALRERIGELERELAETRRKLAASQAQTNAAQAAAADEPAARKKPLTIGGALGVNYVYGDYRDNATRRPTRRGDKVGDVDLELLRFHADLEYDNFIGRAEYRFYDTYAMMHTAWLGYRSDDYGTFKAGIVRVPFGPGPWGVSTSWFFDQHYYVGLADDMDFGVRWSKSFGDLTADAAYYLADEGHWDGDTRDSARYSYDPVRWSKCADADGALSTCYRNGFEEEHQFNLRFLYATEGYGKLGMSFQYGLLDGVNVKDRGADHFAVSAHADNSFGDFSLSSQITYYEYDVTDDTPWGTGDVIPMGAFDWAWPVASAGWIPAFSLRYNGIDTSGLAWLDGVTPFLEWSSIMKVKSGLNHSPMWTAGAVWEWGGLYVYSEAGFSKGNFFIGNEGDDYDNLYGVNHVGANGNDRWHKRFNVNVRYYFDLYK